MNFASKAINTLGSFATNKNVIVAAAGLLSAVGAFGQKRLGYTDKDSIPAAKAPIQSPESIKQTIDSSAYKPTKKSSFPKEKIAKADNGFAFFAVGGTYSPKSSLWTQGGSVNWHGNVAIGKPDTWAHRHLQLRGGYTLRKNKWGYSYRFNSPVASGFGTYSYSPNEVELHGLIGPKIAVPNKKNSRYNKAVIMPYAGVGLSHGWGAQTNEVTFMSPETVVGVNLLYGKIGKLKRDKEDGVKATGPTVAVNLFAEARQQYQNTSFRGQLANSVFPPSDGKVNRNTFRLGVQIALCRQ